jgi:hypothetical protein
MGLLYGRAGRLTAQNGGYRPRRAVTANVTIVEINTVVLIFRRQVRAPTRTVRRASPRLCARAWLSTGYSTSGELILRRQFGSWLAEQTACRKAVRAGLGRIVALYDRSSSLYQIR